MAARRLLTPEQALVLRMLAWCRDFALLLAYKTVCNEALSRGVVAQSCHADHCCLCTLQARPMIIDYLIID